MAIWKVTAGKLGGLRPVEASWRLSLSMTLGSFSNDDGDGSQDVKKAIGLLRKTTTLHVHHAFLYISLPSLDDYDVKMPNCLFTSSKKLAVVDAKAPY